MNSEQKELKVQRLLELSMQLSGGVPTVESLEKLLQDTQNETLFSLNAKFGKPDTPWELEQREKKIQEQKSKMKELASLMIENIEKMVNVTIIELSKALSDDEVEWMTGVACNARFAVILTKMAKTQLSLQQRQREVMREMFAKLHEID